MNILDKIVEYKLKEIAERKLASPEVMLEKMKYWTRPTISLKKELLREDRHGIIAEFKRRSPSKGIINAEVLVEEVTQGYIAAGASALSILTDSEFFGGNSQDLINGREVNACPILRKDFILDEYQIIEAKAMGADVILLIAAMLSPDQLKSLCSLAHSLHLEVLMEVHNEEELINNLNANVDIIGVNNRNLKTFEVSIEASKQLARIIPEEVIKISESGIDSVQAIVELKSYGFRGFLMGQTFMEQKDPGAGALKFINELGGKIG
ncbi:MAG: indole-3-glycerol phosphate synthase TrpC [Cyclobacteriaceae bacterium]|nr:indole-3-glycerol phosphate synthase TrpC [Cyclobacteriaceae bacterium]